MKFTGRLILVFISTLSVVIPFNAWSQKKSGLKILNKYSIGSAGGWDYNITVDGVAKRMYVSHGTQVNVLDVNTGDSLGVVSNTPGVHGIALVPEFGKGYTSNGRANTISVFDLKTNQVLQEIPAGQNPDAIFYDTYSKRIFVFNGHSKDATVIDPADDKVVATIPLGAKPESGLSDENGTVYVNAETTNEIIGINTRILKVTKRFKINGGEAPTGLDIDRRTNRLFIACSDSRTMVIMDPSSGRTVDKFPIGDSDGLVFDPVTKLIFAANNEGTITVVREVFENKFELVETLTTEPSARTIAIDLATHHLFLPAAEMIPATEAGRPQQKPGTFHVIELGK